MSDNRQPCGYPSRMLPRVGALLSVATLLILWVVDASAQTGPCTMPPAAPQRVATKVEKAVPAVGSMPFTPAALTLTWRTPVTSRDASNAAAAFIVEAGSAPGLADVGQTALLATELSLTMPMPNGTYHLRVRSANACGTSRASPDTRVAINASAEAGQPNPLVILSTVHATRERLGTNAFVRVMGLVRNGWRAAPAAFVRVAASYEGPKGGLGVTQATFVTGVPGRLPRTGLVTDTAIEPGGIGCFVLFAQFDSPSVTGLGLVASPSTATVDVLPQRVDVQGSPTLTSNEFGDLIVSGSVRNGSDRMTLGNEVWVEARDDAGRVLDCRGVPIQGVPPDWSLAPNASAAFRSTTEAPYSMSRRVRWWATWTFDGAPAPALRGGQRYEELARGVAELLAKSADAAPQNLAQARDALRSAAEALERVAAPPAN